MGIPLPVSSKQPMLDYIASKPKDKFGAHEYDTGSDAIIAEAREAFRPFQEYFGVKSEI